MKYSFIIAFLLIVCFTSCDGKYRALQTNAEKLEKINLNDSLFVQETHIPETYTEINTDTLLSNGIRIKSKFYSNMDKSVLKEVKKDTILHKKFYREFEVKLEISKNGIEFFSKLINKDFFHKHEFSIKNSLDDAILNDFTIEEFNIDNSVVVLNFDYYPELKDRLYRYILAVYEDGTFKIINEFIIF